MESVDEQIAQLSERIQRLEEWRDDEITRAEAFAKDAEEIALLLAPTDPAQH